jgi:hypothetical protein
MRWHISERVTVRGRVRSLAWECVELPGVTIRHCGHPTALRPYYLEGPNAPPGAEGDRKHRTVAQATAWAERYAVRQLPVREVLTLAG